jgi:DNA-binding Lrp family transcriptional regulator
VLLANLRYWVKENRKDDADYTWHRISASNLAKHLPFSASSVRRALENMLKEGVVKRQKCLGFDNAFVYRIQETINVNQSNPEVNHSKSDIYQPTSVVHQPKPENNNILEDSTEKTSLGRPCW